MVAPSVLLVHDPWGLDPCQDCERHVLAGSHAFLPHHHEACHDAKANLRGHEPCPVDTLVQQRVDDPETRIQQPRPHEGSEEAAQQNRPAREHRQHDTVKKANQH